MEAAATAYTVEVEQGEAHGDGHPARWRLPNFAGRNLGFTLGDGVLAGGDLGVALERDITGGGGEGKLVSIPMGRRRWRMLSCSGSRGPALARPACGRMRGHLGHLLRKLKASARTHTPSKVWGTEQCGTLTAS
jgi:hypothetical protein